MEGGARPGFELTPVGFDAIPGFENICMPQLAEHILLNVADGARVVYEHHFHFS